VAQQPFQQEFQIGIAMAGAISAGAYSAGVLDFLIQALDAWEKARSDPATADRVPNHRVAIKVMTGASAGAITGALGAAGLAQGLTPKSYVMASKQQANCVLPGLYEAWVVKPALVSPTGGSDFLLDDDLNGNDVVSLLNSNLLSQIADSAIRSGAPGAQPLPYIAERFHVYMTLTNLRGIPYKVTFNGGDFVMMCHGDRAHYAITDLGAWSTSSAFADADPGRTLSAKALWGRTARRKAGSNSPTSRSRPARFRSASRPGRSIRRSRNTASGAGRCPNGAWRTASPRTGPSPGAPTARGAFRS
jgi:hypothetical protein